MGEYTPMSPTPEAGIEDDSVYKLEFTGDELRSVDKGLDYLIGFYDQDCQNEELSEDRKKNAEIYCAELYILKYNIHLRMLQQRYERHKKVDDEEAKRHTDRLEELEYSIRMFYKRLERLAAKSALVGAEVKQEGPEE